MKKTVLLWCALVIVGLCCLGSDGYIYKAWREDQSAKADRFGKAFGMKAPATITEDWKLEVNEGVYQRLAQFESNLTEALTKREDILSNYRSYKDSEELAVALEDADANVTSATEAFERANKSIHELKFLSLN